MLKDIFIDLTEYQKTEGVLGTKEGYRCAVGAIAWEEGVPHDTLLEYYDDVGLAEDVFIERDIPLMSTLQWLETEEADLGMVYDLAYIYEPFDQMVGELKLAEMNEKNGAYEEADARYHDAQDRAELLILRGKKLGYNLILACPVKVPSTKQPTEIKKEEHAHA